MNVSEIKVNGPYIPEINTPEPPARNGSKRIIERGEINEGCLKDFVDIDFVDEKAAAKRAYADEIWKDLTDGNLFRCRKEPKDIYNYALEQYNNINNSSDNVETKSMKRQVLESSVKRAVDDYVNWGIRDTYIMGAMYQQADLKVAAEMSFFQFNQNRAIIASARKLTLNFFKYINQNQNYDYDAMMKFVNKNSKNNRDINNLSTTELSDFFGYVKDSNFMRTGSYDDAAFYTDYFSTVSDGASYDIINSIWKGESYSAYYPYY